MNNEFLEIIKKGAAEDRNLNEAVFNNPDVWPIDRISALDYFAGYPLTLEEVLKYLKDCSEKEDVEHLDVAGRATFPIDLVLKSYLFCYSKIGRNNKSNQEYIEGDFLGIDNKGFEEMIKRFLKENRKFNIITFVPVGAFTGLTMEELEKRGVLNTKDAFKKRDLEYFLLFIFLRNFYKLSKLLKKGGLFYLGESYFFEKYYKEYKNLLDLIFKKFGFEVVMKEFGDDTITILLRKLN
jgi:hypothetical protein